MDAFTRRKTQHYYAVLSQYAQASGWRRWELWFNYPLTVYRRQLADALCCLELTGAMKQDESSTFSYTWLTKAWAVLGWEPLWDKPITATSQKSQIRLLSDQPNALLTELRVASAPVGMALTEDDIRLIDWQKSTIGRLNVAEVRYKILEYRRAGWLQRLWWRWTTPIVQQQQLLDYYDTVKTRQRLGMRIPATIAHQLDGAPMGDVPIALSAGQPRSTSSKTTQWREEVEETLRQCLSVIELQQWMEKWLDKLQQPEFAPLFFSGMEEQPSLIAKERQRLSRWVRQLCHTHRQAMLSPEAIDKQRELFYQAMRMDNWFGAQGELNWDAVEETQQRVEQCFKELVERERLRCQLATNKASTSCLTEWKNIYHHWQELVEQLGQLWTNSSSRVDKLLATHALQDANHLLLCWRQSGTAFTKTEDALSANALLEHRHEQVEAFLAHQYEKLLTQLQQQNKELVVQCIRQATWECQDTGLGSLYMPIRGLSSIVNQLVPTIQAQLNNYMLHQANTKVQCCRAELTVEREQLATALVWSPTPKPIEGFSAKKRARYADFSAWYGKARNVYIRSFFKTRWYADSQRSNAIATVVLADDSAWFHRWALERWRLVAFTYQKIIWALRHENAIVDFAPILNRARQLAMKYHVDKIQNSKISDEVRGSWQKVAEESRAIIDHILTIQRDYEEYRNNSSALYRFSAWRFSDRQQEGLQGAQEKIAETLTDYIEYRLGRCSKVVCEYASGAQSEIIIKQEKKKGDDGEVRERQIAQRIQPLREIISEVKQSLRIIIQAMADVYRLTDLAQKPMALRRALEILTHYAQQAFAYYYDKSKDKWQSQLDSLEKLLKLMDTHDWSLSNGEQEFALMQTIQESDVQIRIIGERESLYWEISSFCSNVVKELQQAMLFSPDSKADNVALDSKILKTLSEFSKCLTDSDNDDVVQAKDMELLNLASANAQLDKALAKLPTLPSLKVMDDEEWSRVQAFAPRIPEALWQAVKKEEKIERQPCLGNLAAWQTQLQHVVYANYELLDLPGGETWDVSRQLIHRVLAYVTGRSVNKKNKRDFDKCIRQLRELLESTSSDNGKHHIIIIALQDIIYDLERLDRLMAATQPAADAIYHDLLAEVRDIPLLSDNLIQWGAAIKQKLEERWRVVCNKRDQDKQQSDKDRSKKETIGTVYKYNILIELVQRGQKQWLDFAAAYIDGYLAKWQGDVRWLQERLEEAGSQFKKCKTASALRHQFNHIHKGITQHKQSFIPEKAAEAELFMQSDLLTTLAEVTQQCTLTQYQQAQAQLHDVYKEHLQRLTAKFNELRRLLQQELRELPEEKELFTSSGFQVDVWITYGSTIQEKYHELQMQYRLANELGITTVKAADNERKIHQLEMVFNKWKQRYDWVNEAVQDDLTSLHTMVMGGIQPMVKGRENVICNKAELMQQLLEAFTIHVVSIYQKYQLPLPKELPFIETSSLLVPKLVKKPSPISLFGKREHWDTESERLKWLFDCATKCAYQRLQEFLEGARLLDEETEDSIPVSKTVANLS
jgi:hypothetical protein